MKVKFKPTDGGKGPFCSSRSNRNGVIRWRSLSTSGSIDLGNLHVLNNSQMMFTDVTPLIPI